MTIQPPAAGGPYTVKIAGPQTVELQNVLVGDVWICAGQSNMQFGLRQARNGTEEVAKANYPQIRFYVVGERVSYSPADVPRGSWKVVSPTSVGGFGGISAVAYFYARRMQESLHVPIGLIQEAVGGVPAETFVSGDGLKPVKDFDDGMAEVERARRRAASSTAITSCTGTTNTTSARRTARGRPGHGRFVMEAGRDFGQVRGAGNGRFGRSDLVAQGSDPPRPASRGQRQPVSGIGGQDGHRLHQRRQVGSSSWVENPRVYRAGQGLKPGRNVIAIRLFKLKPEASFISPPSTLRLALGDGSSIPLSGEWKGKVAVDGHPPQPLPICLRESPQHAGSAV